MTTAIQIITNIIIVLSVSCIALYVILGLFFTRKFKPAKKHHKYAILIPARNEESVIVNLLDSIAYQDYPKEYISVFVVADNCTDNTAKAARDKGAICYERFNNSERTKGFALKFLFENIEKDYGIDSFEGYFIFDADNLLNQDYISRMNDAFDSGEKIITSYRNTKNFDENWIASTYALHWLRSIRLSHRARSVLHLATNIQGTGFLFSNELVKDGWRYTSLTEDRAFTADAVSQGYPITYNDAAEFFDEQPTSLRIALRQRLRWSKGHLLAFWETWWPLLKNIFVGKSFRYNDKGKLTKERFVEAIRCRLASLDILILMVPGCVFKLAFWLLTYVFASVITAYFNGVSLEVINGTDILSQCLRFISGSSFEVTISSGFGAALFAVFAIFIQNALARLSFHIMSMAIAVYVFIVERKRIIKIPFYKKIIYTITWPVFDAIGRWTTYIALFTKVEWKPIPHTSKVTIKQIEKSKKTG